jgi:hypothetical protein
MIKSALGCITSCNVKVEMFLILGTHPFYRSQEYIYYLHLILEKILVWYFIVQSVWKIKVTHFYINQSLRQWTILKYNSTF